jgi:hypothetical protein
MEKAKLKLSVKQKEVILKLREKKVLVLSYDRELPMAVVKALLKIKLVDYNDAYDGIILTDLGKTIEL